MIRNIEGKIPRFQINKAEKFFLAIKDLLSLGEHNTRETVHWFMRKLLETYPQLLQTHGNKIFKSIQLLKADVDTKLSVILINHIKTFKRYVENAYEHIKISKGYVNLIEYFITALPPKKSKTVLELLVTMQRKW